MRARRCRLGGLGGLRVAADPGRHGARAPRRDPPARRRLPARPPGGPHRHRRPRAQRCGRPAGRGDGGGRVDADGGGVWRRLRRPAFRSPRRPPRRRTPPTPSPPARACGRSRTLVSATAPTGCRSPPSTSAATWAPAVASSIPTASRPAGGCACLPRPRRAAATRPTPRPHPGAPAPPTACPSSSPSGSAPWPAPPWPVALGAAAAPPRSPATSTSTCPSGARPRRPRRRSTPMRFSSASTVSPPCTPSRPPTVCSATRWRTTNRRPESALSASRRRASRSPCRTRARRDKHPTGSSPSRTAAPGASTTRRSMASSLRSPTSRSSCRSARTTRAHGSWPSGRATCCPSSVSPPRPCCAPPAPRRRHGRGPISSSSPTTRASAAHATRRGAGAGATPLLFFGDPAALPPQVARHAAVVTTAPVAASDLTVLVDRQAATLHPVGRVLQPDLQSAETDRLITELVAPPTDPAGVPVVEPDPAPARRPEPPTPAVAAEALTPGLVDVRLLTVTPRLDGLAEDLPPNRARRAVELVAYLALHQPDVITSDRLRTRVLGSSDADAAAKTLQNTAYAAPARHGRRRRGRPAVPVRLAQRPLSAVAAGHRGRAPCRDDRCGGQGAYRPAVRHGALPRRARSRRGRAAGERPVRLLVVGGRRARRPRRDGPRRRRVSPSPSWPPWPTSSTWPAGASSAPGSSSPTARRCLVPPWSSPPPRATPTGCASNGASASAASTRSIRAAPPRRAPRRSTASSAAACSSRACAHA